MLSSILVQSISWGEWHWMRLLADCTHIGVMGAVDGFSPFPQHDHITLLHGGGGGAKGGDTTLDQTGAQHGSTKANLPTIRTVWVSQGQVHVYAQPWTTVHLCNSCCKATSTKLSHTYTRNYMYLVWKTPTKNPGNTIHIHHHYCCTHSTDMA